MYQWMLFIHIVGSIGMGFYFLLPFLAAKLPALSGDGQTGFVRSLYSMNRISQILIIAQLLTGGYLMSQGDFSHAWMAVVLVLVIAIGAFGGMIGVNMKRLIQGQGGEAAGKIGAFSWILAILLLATVLLMTRPDFFG